MKMIRTILFISILGAQFVYSQYVVKGKITSLDTLEIKHPKIILLSNSEKFPRTVIDSFEVDENNQFNITFSKKGIYRIQFAADNHKSFLVPVYFEIPDTIIMLIKMNQDSTKTLKSSNPEFNFTEGNISIEKSNSFFRNFILAHTKYVSVFRKDFDYGNEGRARGIKDPAYANNYNWTDAKRDFDSLFINESDMFLKNCWGLVRIGTAFFEAWGKPESDIPQELAYYLLENIKPDSPLWSYWFSNLSSIIYAAIGKDKLYPENNLLLKNTIAEYEPFVLYLESAYEKHPDTSIRFNFLQHLIYLSATMNDQERFQKYYDQMVQNYSDHVLFSGIKSLYSPSRRIKPNNLIPPFDFKSIENNYHISDDKLLGKKYIINFWATWCAACKPVLKALENIRKNTNKDDLEIINVSMCYSKEDAIKFIREKIKQPFFNTHLENWRPEQGILKDFEILFIPKTILVDENGKIVSAGNIDEIFNLLK